MPSAFLPDLKKRFPGDTVTRDSVRATGLKLKLNLDEAESSGEVGGMATVRFI